MIIPNPQINCFRSTIIELYILNCIMHEHVMLHSGVAYQFYQSFSSSIFPSDIKMFPRLRSWKDQISLFYSHHFSIFFATSLDFHFAISKITCYILSFFKYVDVPPSPFENEIFRPERNTERKLEFPLKTKGKILA